MESHLIFGYTARLLVKHKPGAYMVISKNKKKTKGQRLLTQKELYLTFIFKKQSIGMVPVVFQNFGFGP
ncbi:hypothetical protein Hanom_Chr14g01246031 [Helianthus anomalus]